MQSSNERPNATRTQNLRRLSSTPERERDDVARREHLLRDYTARKVEEVEVQRNVMERDSALKHRFNRSNRSSGPRAREWMRNNHAVVRELERRDRNDPGPEFQVPQCLSAPPSNYRAQAQASNSWGDARMYRAQYAADVTRIERRIEGEEMVLRQSTRKVKLISATVNAQSRGNLTSACRVQDHLDRIRAHERDVSRKNEFQNARSATVVMKWIVQGIILIQTQMIKVVLLLLKW